MKIQYIDWGRIDYATAWDQQTQLFNQRVQAKLANAEGRQEYPNLTIFCEHPPVYTLGKSGLADNLLINQQQLAERGATFFKIDRGGDITYHGPGQIVVYPIIDLEQGKLGLKQYIHLLEEAVIRFLAGRGVTAERLEGATGVWLDSLLPGKARKICAIGVKSSRHITMHGLALNINTDLSYFHAINPCGFIDKGVTSLQQELGAQQDMETCKSALYKELAILFDGLE